MLVGQALDFDFRLALGSVEETVVVTGEAPLLEVGRGGAAGYVEAEEITQIPISGRDFVQFALLKPTVKVEPQRSGTSLSGQRGVNSGLTIDGVVAKSTFFGYGRGGETTENGGLVIAQESVREFQVVTSGYSAEAGRSGGGYINVVTKGRDQRVRRLQLPVLPRPAPRVPASAVAPRRLAGRGPRRRALRRGRVPPLNWGASVGGPIRKDRAHFFVSWDQTDRSQPFIRDIRGRGQFDAVNARYPEALAGFEPNADGTASADPVEGRTASGQFVRETGNLIRFAKLTHALGDRHTLSARYNFTDFARLSDYVGEESRKEERTHSMVGSLVSRIGETGVNELRVQYALDCLDRCANLPDSGLQANFRIFSPAFASFGKPWRLPIDVDESQLADRFSVLSGNHELRIGFGFNQDYLSEHFASNADGRYDFDSVDDFLNGQAARAHLLRGRVPPELRGDAADARDLRAGRLEPEPAPDPQPRRPLGRRLPPGRVRARAAGRDEHSGRPRQLRPPLRLRLVARRAQPDPERRRPVLRTHADGPARPP